jgi:uncharacterized membrane protein YraQ (UPF0718 family)
MRTIIKLAPYLLVAGALGLAVDVWGPDRLLFGFDLRNNLLSTLLVTLVGVPVYFCNGADVLFLKPLLYPPFLPMGAAIAFSLTSTSVCATSLVLLIRYIGRRLTALVLMTVVLVTIVLSLVIDWLPL